jgi:carbonic anhydrase
MSDATEVRYTAEEALARLKEGNARFVGGEARFPTVKKDVLAALAKGQHPFATVLGCSDSRVPPELVFDAGFGQLFVIRLAGNVLSPEVAGTMQYAGLHLRTPLFVVLGHEGCGAIQAALRSLRDGTRERSRIEALLKNILPGLKDVDPKLPEDEQMRAAVEANVRWTMSRIMAMPEAQEREKEGVMKLAGAVFEFSTGAVRFLESRDGARNLS